MQVVRERCCGLDVHKKSVVACVLTPESQETRTFGTMTRQLVKLSEWLREHEVTHVAMESTGVYWKPIVNLMEDEFTVWVVNARHIKVVPGRKTDVKDAEWIAELLKHGLLRPSFIPERPQRELRELVRYRKSLVQERSREANRIQKVLEGANIKLGSVATDVLGASGRKMLRALADGEDDPKVLADMAKGRLREKLEALEEALLGVVGSHQRFMLATQLRRLSTLDADVERLERRGGPTRSPAQGCAAGGRYDPRRGPSHCRDDRGRDGHRHGQVCHPGTPRFLGRGQSWQQPQCRQVQAKPGQEGQRLPSVGFGGSSQGRRPNQDLLGSPIPPPRTPHRRQQGRHGRCPLHCCHAPLHHQEQGAFRGHGTQIL